MLQSEVGSGLTLHGLESVVHKRLLIDLGFIAEEIEIIQNVAE